MVGVFGRIMWLGAILDTLDQMAQAVGPGPVRVGLAVDFPGAHLILPEFVAIGIPIIAHHLNRATAAVDFHRGRAILLNRKTGGDHGITVVGKFDTELHIVVGFDLHHLAFDHALGHRGANKAGDPFGRA